ncbi:MAG TPA: beta-N-acetylhexosaminidase, partial [Gillisia sp.]|nr:beta-N-acetylhexosaminidase [Gillisia sp.]
MKLSAFSFLFLFAFLSISSLTAQSQLKVIPEPVSTKLKDGVFNLPDQVTIQIPNQPEANYIGKFLKNKLATSTGYSIEVKNTNQVKADIILKLNKKQDPEIGNEGYKLDVTQNQVLITANEPGGLFYGVQTLLQLFPKEIESLEVAENITWEIPMVEIIDYPRFEWRGLMLDVSRHFFTKEEVKQYIDAMVRYKYNVLHMHLTDDEGWRIEIKGYPRLTEVGAWNVKKVGNFGTFIPPTPDEPRDYGGFYTQEDIKELVAYAKDRFVNILPEIDVPGHSLATVVSYPELSCTPEANTYQVRSGEPIMDWSHGAPPIAFVDNTLCPANEKVYEFLDTVISQVAELFPFEYIHMGGDEAPINFWENNPEIKKLMKRENITD